MLIKRAVLDQILSGDVTLAFRRWRRPTVRAGGSLRTAVGMLDVHSVDVVSRSSITVADAHRAGFESRAALLRTLDSRDSGDIYRVSLSPGGPDPRIALREQADLDDADLDDVRGRLARLDARSTRGPWTVETLQLLADNPHVRAQDLADGLGLDKPVFKNDVRKLKALGLTISHSPGYELSPRGQAVLDSLT